MKVSAFSEVNRLGVFLKKLKAQNQKWRYIKYRSRWKYFPKLKIVSRFPTHVDLETTNKCNLRCVMCPHGFPTAEFKKGLGEMDPAMARRIIDEGVKKGLYSIKVNWRGEPLVWKKHMVETVRYAKERGIVEILMNTNGLLMDEAFGGELIDAGIDQVIFSIDGASSETYSRIRAGGNFEKMVHNVERFIEIRNSKGRAAPLVRVQMVKMDSNIHEVDDFIRKWSPLVDSITFQDYTNRGEDGERLTADVDDGPVKIGRRACPQLWQRIIVTWDGKVVMCCRDWDSEQVLGTLDYENGRDIEYFWREGVIRDIRRAHLEGRVDDVPICAKCTYKESFNWAKRPKGDRR